MISDPGDAMMTFGVVARTTGYVALGLSSQHATMVGMDVALLTKDQVGDGWYLLVGFAAY